MCRRWLDAMRDRRGPTFHRFNSLSATLSAKVTASTTAASCAAVAAAASVIADDWRVGPQWSSDWMHRVSFSRM